jgi:hypothetical protein
MSRELELYGQCARAKAACDRNGMLREKRWRARTFP